MSVLLVFAAKGAADSAMMALDEVYRAKELDARLRSVAHFAEVKSNAQERDDWARIETWDALGAEVVTTRAQFARLQVIARELSDAAEVSPDIAKQTESSRTVGQIASQIIAAASNVVGWDAGRVSPGYMLAATEAAVDEVHELVAKLVEDLS